MLRMSDIERAESTMREALAIARRAGDRTRATPILETLGDIAMHQGDLSQAESWYREAVESGRWDGMAMPALARCLVRRGQPSEALAALRKAMRLTEGSDYFDLRVMDALDVLAEVHRAQGDPMAAAEAWGASDGLYEREIGERVDDPIVRARSELIAKTRAAADREWFDTAYEAGRQLTAEKAARLAHDTLEQLQAVKVE
jgi:tetratricopeptide (TPR) repeat protein